MRPMDQNVVLVLNLLNYGAVILDRELRVVCWNRWLERYTGKELAQVRGEKIQELYPHFQKKVYQSFFREALQEDKVMFCSGALHPVFIPPEKGDRRKQNMQIEPVVLEGIKYIFLQVDDITNQEKRIQHLKREIMERTRAEKALRNREVLFEFVVNNSTDIFSILDADGTQRYVSPGGEKVTGFTPEELMSNISQLVHPEDWPRVQVAWEEGLRNPGKPIKLEYRHRHKGGGYVCLEALAQNFLDEPAVRGISVNIRDISERKRMEEELDRQKQNFEAIFRNTMDAIVFFDVHEKVYNVNEQFTRMFGYTLEEVTGLEISRVVDPLNKKNDHLSPFILEGKTVKKETVRYNREGKELQLLIRGAPVVIDGKIVGGYAIYSDITERKEAERALRYQLRFERMVADLSAGLVKLPARHLDDYIYSALRRIGKFFQVDRSFIVLLPGKGGGGNTVYQWNAPGIQPRQARLENWSLESLPWFAEKMRTREFVYIPQGTVLPPEAVAERRELQQQGTSSLLSVPIFIGGKLTGFLGFSSIQEPRSWSQQQILLIKVLAEIFSSAFERRSAEEKITRYTRELELKGLELESLYRQLDEEIERARKIHQRVLPDKPPEVQGYSFAAHYYPAQKLGGDFYDFFRAGQRLVFYLSDVSGHGLDGAMLSIFVKNTINSYLSLVSQDNITPTRILSHLAQQFCRENYPYNYFICLFLCVLELDTGRLSFSSAGFQSLPLVVLGNKRKLELLSKGLPISSAFPQGMMEFQEGYIDLDPGSTLFFTTDGLPEQEAQGALYEDRLRDIFFQDYCLSPGLLSAMVNEDFRQFNQGSLQGRDDITYLILKAVSGDRDELNLEVSSCPENLEEIQHEAEKFLDNRPAAVEAIEKEEVLLSVHELAANAMEHGNTFDPGKKVRVQLVSVNGCLQLTVEDEGPGFSWREKIHQPLKLLDGQERGRGLALTKMLGGKIFYNDRGNRAYQVWKGVK